MRKKIIVITVLAILLVGCSAVINDLADDNTPTVTVSPDITPTAVPEPVPTMTPTPDPTPAPTEEPIQSTPDPVADAGDQQTTTYVLNTSSLKIHLPGCKSVDKIKPENMTTTEKSLEELIEEGYTKCGNCWK